MGIDNCYPMAQTPLVQTTIASLMFDTHDTPVQLETSKWRYWLAIGSLTGLSVLLGNEALSPENHNASRYMSGFCCLIFAYGAISLLRFGSGRLMLTKAGIEDQSGALLCPIDEIAKVDRSAFAFRPSTGFLIRLKSPAKSGWHPGLWWRFGTRLGIGGLTSSSQSKAMASLLMLRTEPVPEWTKDQGDD